MMSQDSTAMADDASVRDPLAPCGQLTFTIDMAAVRAMGMKEICDFRSVMNTLAEVLCGISCQPRFGTGGTYNKAGEVIDTVIDFINGYEQAAVNVARAANPSSVNDLEHRAMTLIGFEAELQGELPKIAVLASEAIHAQLAAKPCVRSAA